MKFLSQVITAASGSIGGVTYSHNRGGMYQRARAIPSNPATERQTIARENMSTAVALWTNDLTGPQRDSWTDYAAATPFVDALGQSVTLTGQQMFIRTSTIRSQAGLAQILDGPVVPGLGNTPEWQADPLLEQTGNAVTGIVDVTDGAAGDFAITSLSRPVNASRTPAHEPTRFHFQFAFTGGNFPIAGVESPWALMEGQVVRVYVILARLDGRISAIASRDVAVVFTPP